MPLSEMIRILAIFSLLIQLIFIRSSYGQVNGTPQQVDLSSRSVRLITIGPGDELWEKFGHNMIEIHADPGYGQDVSMNWGVFDFNQPHFISRFIQGRMLYTMGAFPSTEVLEEYRLNNRQIIIQQLHLTPQQVDRLIYLCELNRLPQNRDYRYNYFTDNCSTRVRDILDRVTDGQIKQLLDTQPTSTLTYRQHTVRLMQDYFWLSLAMDFALGPTCDQPLSAWDSAFLPLRLSASLTPVSTQLPAPWTSTRSPEAATPPDRFFLMLITGIVLAGAMVGLMQIKQKWPQRFAAISAGIWWIIATIGGLFMGYIWLFTDHHAGYANQNLLHYSPLAGLILILWIILLRKKEDVPRIRYLLMGLMSAVILISLLGGMMQLTGLMTQQNRHFIALALPLNLSSTIVVWRSIRRMRTL